MTHPFASLPPADQGDCILCSYVNATSQIQIARISNVPHWYFERVVFPGERLLFETLPNAQLEIHASVTPSAILADKIPCSRLQVKQGNQPLIHEDTQHKPRRLPAMSEVNNDSTPGYDRGIIPAEVAARKQREGQSFGHLPNEFEQVDPESIHTKDGYSIDREGLLNNYAVEPEMYINEPGDLRQQTEEAMSKRRHELKELQEDEAGKLTTEYDLRHKGPGFI